ncbi:hypothetical protein HWV62_17208 [Athelia sp. TMB]|nr:hypothetical protein HWV62_17208 [Athelia sp. TMB]
MPPPAPRTRFIPDLAPLILDALPPSSWWPHDLRRLALAAPAFLAPARTRLYAHPALASFAACALLARTLAAAPHLAALVRALDLKPMRRAGEEVGARELAGVRALLALPHLQTLSIGGEMAVRAERFLHWVAHPAGIHSLAIDGCALGPSAGEDDDGDLGFGRLRTGQPASLEWDESLAFAFSALASLRLAHLELDVAPPTTPTPYGLHVAALTLDNTTVVGGHLLHLLHGAWPALRRLAVAGKDAPAPLGQLAPVLAACAGTLTHAALAGPANPLPLLPREMALVHLALDGAPLTPADLALLPALAPHLVSLHVAGRTTGVPAEAWAAWIEEGACGELRELGLPGGTCGPPWGAWGRMERERVREAAAARGISLVGGA